MAMAFLLEVHLVVRRFFFVSTAPEEEQKQEMSYGIPPALVVWVRLEQGEEDSHQSPTGTLFSLPFCRFG